MAVLLLAEMAENGLNRDATAKAVTAVKPLGDVTVLVAGAGAQAAAARHGGQDPVEVLGAQVLSPVPGGREAFGLLTRPAAFLASGMMAVAYFWMHFPDGFWPLVEFLLQR